MCVHFIIHAGAFTSFTSLSQSLNIQKKRKEIKYSLSRRQSIAVIITPSMCGSVLVPHLFYFAHNWLIIEKQDHFLTFSEYLAKKPIVKWKKKKQVQSFVRDKFDVFSILWRAGFFYSFPLAYLAMRSIIFFSLIYFALIYSWCALKCARHFCFFCSMGDCKLAINFSFCKFGLRTSSTVVGELLFFLLLLLFFTLSISWRMWCIHKCILAYACTADR